MQWVGVVGARLSRVVSSCVVAAWLSAARFEGGPLGEGKKRRGPFDESDMAGEIGQGRQRPVRAMIRWTETRESQSVDSEAKSCVWYVSLAEPSSRYW